MNKEDLINKIPSDWTDFISFVETISEDCYFDTNKQELMKHELLIDEVEIANKQFLIEIDISKNKITFIDDLTSFDDDQNELPMEPINKLIKLARKNNMQFYNRGDGNDNYYWYGLQINADSFNYEDLKRFIEEWHSYNRTVEIAI